MCCLTSRMASATNLTTGPEAGSEGKAPVPKLALAPGVADSPCCHTGSSLLTHTAAAGVCTGLQPDPVTFWLSLSKVKMSCKGKAASICCCSSLPSLLLSELMLCGWQRIQEAGHLTPSSQNFYNITQTIFPYSQVFSTCLCIYITRFLSLLSACKFLILCVLASTLGFWVAYLCYYTKKAEKNQNKIFNLVSEEEFCLA